MKTTPGTRAAIKSAVLQIVAGFDGPFTLHETCFHVAHIAGVTDPAHPERFGLTHRQPAIVAGVLEKLVKGGLVEFRGRRGYRRAW